MIIIDTTVDWPGIGATLAGKMAWLDRDLTIVDRPLRIENIVCQKVHHLSYAHIFRLSSCYDYWPDASSQRAEGDS